MAGGQTAEAQKGGRTGSSTRRRILIGGAVVLFAGMAAGTGLWQMQNVTPEAAKLVDARKADEGQALLPLGRITVNVGAAGALSEKRTRFLVIEPTLLYAASFDTGAEGAKDMPDQLPALRDSFIEYLSQLHENDVYGSAGLADLRAELLRRARLVTASDAPISILLQDFVLQ